MIVPCEITERDEGGFLFESVYSIYSKLTLNHTKVDQSAVLTSAGVIVSKTNTRQVWGGGGDMIFFFLKE